MESVSLTCSLARLNTPAAEDALVGIVAVERICVIDLVGLRGEGISWCSMANSFVVLWTVQFPLLLSQTVQ